MPIVVGVQFKPVTKVYHFDPDGQIDLGAEDFVIVDTARGPEVAQVVQAPHLIGAADVVGEMKKVVRRASAWDLVQRGQWLHKEQEASALCKVKAKEHNLPIKLVRCEYSFDGGRLLIYFASEERVDFRALVRDLARVFRTRIEMRQIGVRDEAKLLDGVGKCGRQLCCTSWLREFTPVSIRMAKSQQLPLNPDEISGVCGRLLCCLSYEDDLYREQNKKMPKLGAEVITPHGAARVRHIHPLKESVTVMLENHALVEVPVAILHERLRMRRARATWLTALLLVALGSLSALSSSTLSGVQLAGMNLFDLFDFLSSKLLMPITGLLTCLFVLLRWKQAGFVAANSNEGALHNTGLLRAVFTILTKVTPLLILTVMLYGLLG